MEVSGYRIKRTIGQGGMGTVYLATQESLDRDVCLKTMNAARSESTEYFERFVNEGRIVAGLQHLHIITIHDIGAVDDTVYIAMEYVDGGDLKQRLRDGFSPPQALDLLIRIGGALDLAHQRGIIHRDVKPANILFRKDGTPLLSDFGIAKQVRIDTELTSTGTILGSPFYMSPEQSEGRDIDGRTDIYSLGVIFYEMLTGERPYEGDSPIKIILAHLQTPIPTLPKELEKFQPLLNRLLAKRRNDRFPTMAAMIDFVLTRHDRDLTAPDSHARAAPEYASAAAAERDRSPRWHRAGTLAVAAIGLALAFWGLYLYSESLTRSNVTVSRLPPASGRVSAPAAPRPAGTPVRETTPATTTAATDGGPSSISIEVVKDAIARLAAQRLSEERLTTPPADNAYYYYSRLLSLDPGSRTAENGFVAIAERYVALAEKQYAARNDEEAQRFITLGLHVDPDNDGLIALRSFIATRKRTTFESLVDLVLGRG